MSRAASCWLLCALLGATGCATEGEGLAPSPPEPRAPEGLRLTAIESAGLDVVQVGGGADVDYIIDSIGCGAAWLDYDGDGDADLYLANGATRENPDQGPPDRLLRNDGLAGGGIPRFTDVTAAAGLGDRSWSFGVSAADFDNDGDTDLYLTNWGPNRLYRNRGDGTFDDVAQAAGVLDPSWSASSAWGDVDRDGDLDLYVANYVEFSFERYPARGESLAGGAPPCNWKGLEVFCGPRNLVPAADRFFRNEGDTDGDGIVDFVEAGAATGLAGSEALFALVPQFLDVDGDGDTDLYVANDSVRNSYFVNRGDGTFEEMAILAGVAYNEQGLEQASMGIASGDVDGDGLVDLVVTNFSHDHDTLYRNVGQGMFTDVSYPLGLGSASFLTLGWGVVLVDLDQDSWEDLFVAHGHVYPQVDGRNLGTTFRQPNALFRNLAGRGFADVSAGAGSGLQPVKGSRAVLPHDLDGDGDLDLLITNLNDVPDLLLNETQGGHWLQVRLHGLRSNRDGIGARVLIEAGARRQLREVRRDVSYGAVLPLAHFGLGPAATVEHLEVHWPSGEVTRLNGIEADRTLELFESPDGNRP